MRPVNLLEVETTRDADDPSGYETPYARVAPLVGGRALGASIYVLNEGQSVCPYHYEYGNEEWLLVLSGRPSLRTPEGERDLEPGDVVCFREGPDGAHKAGNRHPEPARIVIFSTTNDPSIAVYPDSDKVGAWPPGKLFRLSDAVDYWEGEL
ncbi:MAG TPA: cupin domain-containing protein [Gaiellaceae bacterium]|nr:cupin domain-containing protein [Gaiellaceae bacterium]